MTNVTAQADALCSRCGHTVRPRGGATPVYCSVCGQRLRVAAGNVEHRFQPVPAPTRGDVVAVVLGIASFLPWCGFPLGLGAVVLSARSYQRRDAAGRRTGMPFIAQIGMILGIIGIAAQCFWCLRYVGPILI